MLRAFLCLAACLALSSAPAQADGRMVSLAEHGSLTDAYLALPDQAPLGNILVIHDQWGLSRHAKSYADSLARAGYVALVIDLYDGQVPSTSAGAQAMTKAVSVEGASHLVRVGIKFLHEDPTVRHPRISVVGFGIGARWALQACASVPGLTACIACDGPLDRNPELIQRISAPVLGIFPRRGSTMNEAAVRALANSLNAAGKPAEIYLFNTSPGFFTSDSTGGFGGRARGMILDFIRRQSAQPLAGGIPRFKEEAVKKKKLLPFLPF